MRQPKQRRRDLRARARVVAGVGLVIVAVAAGVLLSAAARVTAPVLVAAVDLEAGDTLTAQSVRTVEARLDPEQAALVLAPGDLANFEGHYVRHHLAAGEFVSLSVLGRVPRESRVFSFSLERADAVGARVRPGDSVDVVASSGSGSSACTRVVASAVKVVAVVEDDDSAVGGSAVEVTLEVAQEDVVAVTHARKTGAVTLALSSGAPTRVAAEMGSCSIEGEAPR